MLVVFATIDPEARLLVEYGVEGSEPAGTMEKLNLGEPVTDVVVLFRAAIV